MKLLLIYLLGLAMLFAELFVPGVVMGVVGGVLVIYAIAAAWGSGETLTGGALTATTVVVVPLMIRFALRRLKLSSSPKSGDESAATETGLSDLVGRSGVALTTLRPAGTAEIDGRRVSVVAELGLIEASAALRVIKVEGNRVVVRPVTTGDEDAGQGGRDPDPNRL